MTERVPVDRRLLPRTFGAWFERFSELTEVQRQSIPAIMLGSDVLICSPTASGKTEAYAAPATEIAIAGGGAPGSVIIVSPTRALANDLKRRLEAPMGAIDLTFGRYTGEHKERVAGRWPTVVVTTPEALDSLLARRPQTFGETRMVVLDEIHFLDGTPRGDQLRVLLHRLQRVRRRHVQRVAVSATVDRPAELAGRYLADAVQVVVPGTRRMRVRAFDGRDPVHVAQHVDDLASHGFRKVLVFCRSRNAVESCVSALRKWSCFRDHVHAHHGSLARTQRERTERLFQQAPAAVCVATTTLEMGIDIGTIDYVLMAGLPTDVASLLQRVGRGCRRTEGTRAGYAIDDLGERYVFETLFRLARDGRLCAGPYAFRPDVLVQQALVLAASQGWVDGSTLRDVVPPELLPALGSEALAAILELLCDAELLERSRSGRFVATEVTERRYERGTLHSNIADSVDTEVVDRLTGDVIGVVDLTPGERVTIGGSERQIVRSTDERLLTDATRDAKPAQFRPRGRPWVQFVLARAVVESLGVPRDRLLLRPGPGHWILIHGLGTVGALLLADRLGVPRDNVTPYTAKLPTRPATSLTTPSEDAAGRFVTSNLIALERILGAGPYRKQVPLELRASTTRRACDIDSILEFLRTATVLEQALDDPANEEIVAFL